VSSRRLARPLLLLLGALTVISLVGVDPAALGLLLDIDFLVLLATVGVAMLRTDVGVALARLRTRPPVVMVRAGLELTRSAPRSLL
jgi:hypothetical protein